MKQLIAVLFLHGIKNPEKLREQERERRALGREERQSEYLLKMLHLKICLSRSGRTFWRWQVGHDVFYMQKFTPSRNRNQQLLRFERARIIGGKEIVFSRWRPGGNPWLGESIVSFDGYPMPFSEWRIWVAGLRSMRRAAPPSGGQL